MPDDLARSSNIDLLERLAVKVMFATEAGKVRFDGANAGPALRGIVVKLTNEVFAFIGTLRAGSLHGGFHHQRAVIELIGAIHYLFADPAEVERRCERYVTWPEVEPYLRRKRLVHRHSKGKVPQLRFDIDKARLDGQLANVSDTQVKDWSAIYGQDLSSPKAHRVSWHDPKTISDLVYECDNSTGLLDHYDIACHATHVSPLAPILVSRTGLRMLGGDRDGFYNAVGVMLGLTISAAKMISDATGGALAALLEPERREYVSDVAPPLPGASAPEKQEAPPPPGGGASGGRG